MKISFGIKTHLKNEYKTLMAIHSILAQKIDDDFEILITGNTHFTSMSDTIRSQSILLPDEEAAQQGLLPKMMNTLAAHARYGNICLMDDDIILLDGWYEKLKLYVDTNPDFQVLAFPVKNTNGSRFWDWAALEEEDSRFRHQVLSYNEKSTSVYVTGGMSFFRKNVWQSIQWDETKGFYEAEDVDWSRRVWQWGYKIDFCKNAFVLHNDWRYFYDKNYIAINQYTDIVDAFHDNYMDTESELIRAEKDRLKTQQQLQETQQRLQETQQRLQETQQQLQETQQQLSNIQKKLSHLLNSREYWSGRWLLTPYRKLKQFLSKCPF